MTTAVIVGVVTAAVGSGGLFAGVFQWLGNRRVAEVQRLAAERESEIQARSADTQSWASLAEAYSRQIADMALSYGALDERLQRVEAELTVERVQRVQSEARADALTEYIYVLRRWISGRYPGEDIPEIPAECLL